MMSEIKQALDQLRQELPEAVTLVAVSKRQPLEKLREAYDAGQRDFGENKVQELEEKVKQFPDDIKWHFIGHLQTNKVKYIAPFVHLIHSVDSLKLMKEIEKRAAQNERSIRVLWQLHIADEESKFGLDKAGLQRLVDATLAGSFPHVEVCGLMGMATFTDDEEQIRREFQILKTEFERLKPEFSNFKELSMGMSGDYPIALDMGSSMLRIGTTIFGERNY
jgi:pyridoxal phosphate enzyme (YggS family)